MDGIGRREKMARRAGAGERRADLARDVPRLADAAAQHRCVAANDAIDGGAEFFPHHHCAHRANGVRLSFDHFGGQICFNFGCGHSTSDDNRTHLPREFAGRCRYNLMGKSTKDGLVDYRVEIPVYNGPMDLLLYLLKRDELDIYDIPIARIT